MCTEHCDNNTHIAAVVIIAVITENILVGQDKNISLLYFYDNDELGALDGKKPE